MCVRDSATQHHKGGEAADLNTVDTGNTSGHAMTNFILLTSLLAYGGSSFPIKMSITYDMIRGRRQIIARSSPTAHHSLAFKDRIFWYISASPWPNLLGKSNNKMAHWLYIRDQTIWIRLDWFLLLTKLWWCECFSCRQNRKRSVLMFRLIAFVILFKVVLDNNTIMCWALIQMIQGEGDRCFA